MPSKITNTSKKTSSRKGKPRRYVYRQRDVASTIILFILILLLAGSVIGGGTLMAGYLYFSRDLPSIHTLKDYKPNTVTYFFSDDGRIIARYSKERRYVVPLEKIPKHVIQAFIAAEDSNFYHHSGVDYTGILRAFVKNVTAGRIVQGGSTITQQVTKTFLLTREKTISRKVREIILAYRIDRNLTKDEILHLYLNQIYLGHGAYGVEAAAQTYFNVSVNKLTLAQAALIAGLTQAPSRYSPYTNLEQAKTRQNYCLNRMAENGFITREKAAAAKAERLRFYDPPSSNASVAPHFTEHVRRFIVERYGEDRLYHDGLKVYTTLNIDMQKAANEAVNRGLGELSRRQAYLGPVKTLSKRETRSFLKKQTEELGEQPLRAGQNLDAVVTAVDASRKMLEIEVGPYNGYISRGELEWAAPGDTDLNRSFTIGSVIKVSPVARDNDSDQWSFSLEQSSRPQAALVCRDVRTGEVKALVGGTDFEASQFNRAIQARRQPGSAFKPIIYSAALDNGFTAASLIIDSPIVFTDYLHDRKWKPRNYDNKFEGPTLLYMGLARSRNVVTIKVLDRIGIGPVLDLARNMGITSPLSRNLTLALGSSGVSLMELTTAYTVFPRLGDRVEPIFISRVEDRDGNLIERFRARTAHALSPQTAYIVLTMLEGVVQRGTATSVRVLGRPVAGKTGTTNDLADAWFIGFTPRLLTGVWVGHDEMQRLGYDETGGKAAAPIFIYFMQEALRDQPVEHFDVPGGIVFANIDLQTGRMTEPESERSIYLAFREGSLESGFFEEGDESEHYKPAPEEELSEKDL